MLRRAMGLGRMAVLATAVLSPFASYLALARGWALTGALPLGALQALAAGVVLWGALPPGRQRALAVLLPAALLLALATGAWRSPATGLLAVSGMSHALLYAGLLALFGASLSPGRTPLVTMFARRLNPAFHSGMESYTRAVTIAWCLFFTGEIVVSAVLLVLAPETWRLFVTVLNLPLVVLMALAEYGIRRRRLRHEPHTTLLAMARGVRSSGPILALGSQVAGESVHQTKASGASQTGRSV